MLIGTLAALLLGAVLAARPADPAVADPPLQAARQRYLSERSGEAARALDALRAALGPARDAARRGAALLLAGDEPPQPALEDAARLMEGAASAADLADVATDALRGVLASARPAIHVPPAPSSAELRGIAGQLRQAAEAAGTFVERRVAAERTLRRLGDALAALEAGDAATAMTALDDARRARARLAAWDPAPVTLPLWLRTTRRMIAAADTIAQAVRDGNRGAAERAAADYGAAAEDARRADVSLALSLSEAGSGLTETPLRRLGHALAAIEETSAVVASVAMSTP